eukprot:TRINITY_DN23514_c0_g1_i1.p1 TRINITY_DN23514_c0_g1~~TRINITY_DN23514_c0_g1_i1.p1  ORF type:complete len:386 (+),score=68.10 TRINITY_DN23514_c0_g1_i1:30-1160(+)
MASSTDMSKTPATKSSTSTVRKRDISPNPAKTVEAAGVAKKSEPAQKQQADKSSSEDGVPPLKLAIWILLLVATQMVMLIYTKRATDRAPLPLVLCIAQFLTSAVLAGATSLVKTGKLPWMPRTLWPVIVPLSATWTAGFVLFNASASFMSPAVVSLVRCMEPLATVCVGFIVLGDRYSWRVLSTLVPICGGVVLASFKGGSLSTAGLILAGLSNVSFCGRPFFTQKLKVNPENKLDDISVFFNVTCVSVVLLPVWVLCFEGAQIQPLIQELSKAGNLGTFGLEIFLSSVFFFMYQFIQLIVMSKLGPLAFSVLTPIVKAFMIVACSLYFGDPFGFLSAIGVAISTGGGYLFTLAKNADAESKAAVATASQALKKD